MKNGHFNFGTVMRFIDEVKITVRSGKGGPGAVSFRREKYIPKGGPDGGDGGDGGSLRIVVKRDLRTLYDVIAKHTIKAENGHSGTEKTALCTCLRAP